jgi:uncharacterized damage-inducible protein DinB
VVAATGRQHRRRVVGGHGLRRTAQRPPRCATLLDGGPSDRPLDHGRPMDATDLLIEAFGRVPEHVREAVDGLDADALATAPEPGANPIGWQVWHLTRVADSYVAELTGQPQVWVADDWAAGFGLRPDPDEHGYGHTPEQVAAVRPTGPDVLIGYHAAVAERTTAYLRGLSPDALDEVIDRSWDPPVTLGVRLISIVDDQVQHAGQAAYVRGLLDRR